MLADVFHIEIVERAAAGLGMKRAAVDFADLANLKAPQQALLSPLVSGAWGPAGC
jgi:hypothetical protein